MMAYNDRTESRDSDPLTTVVLSFLVLVAVGGTVFCLVYAIWWLITFWAPF